MLPDATTRPRAGAAPAEMRDALGTGYVVTGSVQAEGDQVRVAAAPVDVETGRKVWAGQQAGPADDLLALQATVAEALAGALAGRYSGAIADTDRARALRAQTDRLDAYEIYLLGVREEHRFTPEGYLQAEAYLERAVELDPDFARAWAKLVLIDVLCVSYSIDPEEFGARDASVRKPIACAVAADLDDPTTLLRVADQRGRAGDRDGAEDALRRVVEVAGNDADMLAEAAIVAELTSQSAEAAEWAERARALNPEAPDWYRTGRGMAAFALGDDAGTVAAMAEGPLSMPETHVYRAAAEARMGDLGAAAQSLDALRAEYPECEPQAFLQAFPREPKLQASLTEWAGRAFAAAAVEPPAP